MSANSENVTVAGTDFHKGPQLTSNFLSLILFGCSGVALAFEAFISMSIKTPQKVKD